MRLVQVAQYSSDLERSEAFYRSLLGTEPAARFEPPGLLFFQLEGVRLLLDSHAPRALIYLAVPSIADALARIGADSAVRVAEHLIFTHEDERLGPVATEEWHAFVEDPDENPVGLVEFRPVG